MEKPIFLILDNSQHEHGITEKIIKHYQKNSYITTVKTPQQALERMKEEVPDLFFFDSTPYEKNHSVNLIWQTLQEVFLLSPIINIYLCANKITYLTSLIDDIEKHKGGFVIDTKSWGGSGVNTINC